MSNVSMAVEAIRPDIEGKRVLEVACGSAEFAIEAAKTAAKVCCIDLTAARLPENITSYENIEFIQMDAAAMTFPDASFGTAVVYNGMARLEDALAQVIAQCRRVVGPEGCVYFISSWTMDKFVIEQSLLPALVEAKAGVGHTKKDVGSLTIVRIG